MKAEFSNREEGSMKRETDKPKKRTVEEVRELPTSLDPNNGLKELPKEVGPQNDVKEQGNDLPREFNDTNDSNDNRYDRPSGWRAGMRDQVWENAKDDQGRVRDPVTGKYMAKDQPWDMGHKPGYEFKKHQESAKERNIDRAQFLDEYYNPDHYRPELPSSNRSHKGEDVTDNYFGD